MSRLKKEAGTAFIMTAGLLFLITLLGLATFRWSVDEIGIAANQKASVQAQYIAESGAALMLQWFQEPQTFPAIGVFPQGEPIGGAEIFLARRKSDSWGAASFFNEKGQSQFLGTGEVPDFLYQSTEASPDGLGGVFAGLGTLTSLKLFSPITPGAIATVEATGTTGSGISRTVIMEIIPSPVPPTAAAVQIGPGTNGPLPSLIHWGDLRFGLDKWDYQSLKTFAKTWGVYFGTDREGFLYRDGVLDIARRTTPLQALTPDGIGSRRGFVFIDTVDQKPPDGTNLATLDLPVDYIEGIFSVQAHLAIRELGPGRSIEVRTPPVEGSDDPSTRQTVVLSAIHLKGILSVAGLLSVEGRPNVFGALIAQQGFAGSGQPEVWYDADLRKGYYPGLPTVTMLKGSWYIR
ncbi:MAG: hypothetical protein HY283_01680 [Nitrospirae bacterium]|nr:hypothetical protein [Nitrospirota bacterium]